ncbi:MAG: alpha/beta hydrolase [Actinomycetota bacterium]|nr:alpha/beta hydrolase [Actinomycetota bacterium]
MPVDPALQTLLDAIASMGDAGIESMSPDEARVLFKDLALTDGDPVEVAVVENRSVHGPNGEVPVRVYTPAGSGPFGVLVWIHGGGWVIGDLDTADPTARKLCAAAEVVVVSVDYGLAPEHPSPAPLQDCWAVVQWVADHATEIGGDSKRLAVGGDSAGGNLAAVVAQKAVADGGPHIALQALVYPATDLTLSHPSVIENGEGYFLTAKGMAWFTAHYLSGADPRQPELSPLFADDVSGVAPAVVITAEFDPLRDEGEAYAAKLEAAGVAVTSRRYDGMVHGFFSMGSITPVADQAVELVVGALRTAMAGVDA